MEPQTFVIENVAVTPRHTIADFPTGRITLDQVLEIFEAQTLGWQIEIAEFLAENHPHAGFAVLAIVMSYFENIAKFKEGVIHSKDSKAFFRKGVYWVIPDISNYTHSHKAVDTLYGQVRSELYHARLTGPDIVLTGELPSPMMLGNDGGRIIINPKLLVKAVKNHFIYYMSQLRDPSNADLRDNFAKRFLKLSGTSPAQ